MDIPKTFTKPTKGEARFQVEFQVGINKIPLYGSPATMSLKSELIRTLLDTLSTDEINVLAPSMDVNKEALYILWMTMNGIHVKYSEKPNILIGLWPLLNYFNIDVKDEFITEYIDKLIKYFPKELFSSENKDILTDVMTKIKIMDEAKYNLLMNSIIDVGGEPVRLWYVESYMKPGKYNLNFPEKILSEDNTLLLSQDPNTGNKFYILKSKPDTYHRKDRYFMAPEWHHHYGYVMDESDSTGVYLKKR